MTATIGWLIVAIIAIAIIIAILAKWYQRGTREVSLIRTGLGGRKVVLDGGVLAIPFFTDVTRINMQTLRLEVKRQGAGSLITKDKLRVDVGVEFYVSVIADEEGVSRAAQTLGNKTFHHDALRDLIEGKLVDALRSVAATFELDELHIRRGDYVTQVKTLLDETLARNGLSLDSVSLTDMDQTPFASLDENNAFNAEGMRKLSSVIADAKKQRAKIDTEAEVAVRQSALSLAKQKLDIELQEEQARIAQAERIESLRAEQMASIAQKKADSERSIAQAQIAMEQQIQSATIERDKLLKEAELQRNITLALLEQDNTIALQQKQKEEQASLALLSEARAIVAAKEEFVATERAVAEAEREKRLAEIVAEQEALASAIRTRISAEAEKQAASDRSAAQLELAKAEQQTRELLNEVKAKELATETDAKRQTIKAENEMSEALLAHKNEQLRLETLPKVLAEAVKPAEKIDSIKVHHVTGLGEGKDSAPASPVNQTLDTIMSMAVQWPTLKKMGEELKSSLDSKD